MRSHANPTVLRRRTAVLLMSSVVIMACKGSIVAPPNASIDTNLFLKPDATAPDTSAPDTAAPDTYAPDTAIADTAVPDIAAPDAAQPDIAAPDAAQPDTAQTDTGTTGAGFKSNGCKKFVNTNTDGTVNPFITPARNGQFYVSYVKKGGDLMLTWEDPSSCKTVEGPLQVNKTNGEVYYWGGINVISDLDGNFFAVWESSGKGKEISFAWSKTGKTFNADTELVTTSTNGQDPVLWTDGPGKLHAAWRGHHATLKQYDPYYAKGLDVFSSKPFDKGILVHSDAAQDDQVSVVTDSKGNLHLAWQSFDDDIFISSSVDSGKTWSKALQVNDVKGKANVGKATFLTVTPDDRLVLMWSDKRKSKSGNENDVFSDSSSDGKTWGADVQVNDNDARYQEDPAMAVGNSPGCKGHVYAVWQDFRHKKSYDIYLARSIDGGKTWQKNEPVASDLEGDEMNPAIAVDNTCVIGVAWRDSTKTQGFDIGSAYFTWK